MKFVVNNIKWDQLSRSYFTRATFSYLDIEKLSFGFIWQLRIFFSDKKQELQKGLGCLEVYNHGRNHGSSVRSKNGWQQQAGCKTEGNQQAERLKAPKDWRVKYWTGETEDSLTWRLQSWYSCCLWQDIKDDWGSGKNDHWKWETKELSDETFLSYN